MELPSIKNGNLETDELMYVLQTTLMPYQMEDPTIIRWILSYSINRDIDQAAKDAGVPRHTSKKLRYNKHIDLALSKITEASVNKFGYDSADVVQRVKEIGEVDPAAIIDPETGAAFNNLHDIPAPVRRAIKKFKVKNLFEKDPNGVNRVIGEMVEVEFWNKDKALELLGREKELFTERKKVEHDVTSNMKELLLERSKRGEAREIEVSAKSVNVELPKLSNRGQKKGGGYVE